MNTVEEFWQSYKERVLPDINTDQVEFARMCFWAGAGAQMLLIETALMMDPEPARAQFEALQNELRMNYDQAANSVRQVADGTH